MKKVILTFLIMILVLPMGSSFATFRHKKNFKGDFSGNFNNVYIDGEILVEYKEPLASVAINKLKEKTGIEKTIKTVQGGNNIFLYRLKSGVSVESAQKKLLDDPNVIYAEPNYIRKVNWVPNDTYYSYQWALPVINAPAAWDIEKGYTNPVKVAVIDSGIDDQHPDLIGKISAGYNWAGISQRSFTNVQEFASNSGNTAFAQSIKGTGQPLTHIGLALLSVGNPTSNITVSVRSSINGPDLASYVIPSSDIPSSPAEIYRPLSVPVTLTSGNPYFIVASVNSSDSSNYYYILNNFGDNITTINTYVDGQQYDWNGSSWDPDPNYDLYFHTNQNDYPRDDVGHGTLTSGIIGANTNNATGIAGISPGAAIMPLKVIDSAGIGESSDIISAITYAADNGAKVINISLGGDEPSLLEQQVVNYAYRKGVVIFAAAGNSGDSTFIYPAAYNHVVSVGSTNNSDSISFFSNHNSMVDVTAPGEWILSTMPTYPVLFTIIDGLNYAPEMGTSFSAPMASGLGALILSKNPSFSPAQVESIIESNADDKGDPGRDDFYGYGRINTFQTLLAMNRPPVLSSIHNKTVKEGSVLSFTVDATDSDGDVLTYSASNLPPGASFNPFTRQFYWKPTHEQAGKYLDVHFEAADAWGAFDFENIKIIVTNSN